LKQFTTYNALQVAAGKKTGRDSAVAVIPPFNAAGSDVITGIIIISILVLGILSELILIIS
jgi:hypothetical protein